MFSKRLQDIFKTSSRHLQDVLQKCLQDVFRTYYQVKMFFVTQFQDVLETYSKRFLDVLLRCLSTLGLPRSHFWEIYGQCIKSPRVIKISQVLVFHFTTPFCGYTLQRRIYNMVEHLQWSFFCENTYQCWAVNFFARKAPSQMFDWVENRFLVKGFTYWAHFCSQTIN